MRVKAGAVWLSKETRSRRQGAGLCEYMLVVDRRGLSGSQGIAVRHAAGTGPVAVDPPFVPGSEPMTLVTLAASRVVTRLKRRTAADVEANAAITPARGTWVPRTVR